MAREKYSYDHANCTITREWFIKFTGSAVVERFSAFQKFKAIAVHGVVRTAGTATVAAATIRHISGTTTTSIGAIAFSTSTAGVSSSVDLADREIASLDQLTFTNGADATLVADLMLEYQVMPDAVQSE